MPQLDIDVAIDRLYSLPLDEFVAARDELVSRLRAADDKESGEAVRRLRKPTLVAWGVNQLVHRHHKEIDKLLVARDQIAEDATATREHRRLLNSLTRRAGTILSESGHHVSPDTERRISATLLAASSGTEEEAFRAGRLTRELQPEGFEGAFGTVNLPETAAQPEDGPGGMRRAMKPSGCRRSRRRRSARPAISIDRKSVV